MKKFVQSYIAYIKDNPNGYWFKRKMYGWGWVPATREGWLITLGVVAFVIWRALSFEQGGYPEEEVFDRVVIPALAAVGALVLVCLFKGESPEWQWGLSKKDTQEIEIDISHS